MTLITKLTVTISVILLMVMAPFAYFKMKTIRRLMLEESVRSADTIGETIIRTTHYQMLENDRKRLYEVFHEVGTQPGIEHIRMINKDGEIIYSTEDLEVGTLLDKKAAACNMCHSTTKPLISASSMNRSRIFRTADGLEVLGLAKAIYNEESCSSAACHFHSPDQRTLGVLDIILALDSMRAQVRAYRNINFVTTFVILALTGVCLTLLMRRLVHRPIRQLVRETAKVAAGDLTSSVHLSSTPEFAHLAGAFNNMTQSLKKARDELEDWGRNLESKVEERTRELQQMQAQLVRSEKLASLGELVAGIAHELNNPLTGVLVFSSLIAKDPKLDPELRSDIDVIVRETQRCAVIVKGLLDFSRESIPKKERSSINAIMERTLSLIGNQSFFHDIEIQKHYDPDVPSVLVDPNQIEQVFINMLLNASQAMNGSGTLTIRTDAPSDSPWVCIEIADTGCGIPEESLSKVFDPFFSTKESKGTGLGLSVSYGIIENHGGQIEVRSEVGVGTTFTIRLPVEPPEETAGLDTMGVASAA